MKLKPIHWILIAVLLIEALVLGIWFGNKGAKPVNTTNPTELLLSYNANTDGSYSLISLLETVEAPEIKFTYNDVEYEYDDAIALITEAYRSFENYKTIEPDATEELWAKFKESVEIETWQKTNKQHPSIEFIRGIAENFDVQYDQLYSNSGRYAINATTTINGWQAVFGDYIKEENGKMLSELALGATMKIGDDEYNALVYTVVNADSDSANNSTAQEVSVHIIFGDEIINDIAISDATIYYLKPDGSEYFAHSDLKVTYLASNNEARYRDILILGGTQ